MAQQLVADFLAKTASDPFEWGRNDCALWCADFVKECTGYDPAEPFRGTYNSWLTCRNLLIQNGGLIGLITPRMNPFEVGELVGIATVRGRDVCGLFTGGKFCMKAEKVGFVATQDFQFKAGWTWLN